MSAYMKARRDQARATGKCQQCCIRALAPHSKSRCLHCLGLHAEYIGELRAARDWCDECLAAGFHREDCALRKARAA